MSEAIGHRLKQVRIALGLNQSQMAEIIGVKQGTYSPYEKKGNIPNEKLELLKYKKHVNIDWILLGNGDMFEKTNIENQSNLSNVDKVVSEVKQLDQAIVMQVPLVNQYAYAGYTSGFQDETYIAQLPVIPFFVDHEAKGNYMAFEVRGDSMNDGSADSYIEGDRLLGREISPNLWCQTKLHLRKWDFIIVHEDGILIKRIIDHDVSNHTITIHSLNPLYEDRVIDLCGVKQIFNVIELQRPKRR